MQLVLLGVARQNKPQSIFLDWHFRQNTSLTSTSRMFNNYLNRQLNLLTYFRNIILTFSI